MTGATVLADPSGPATPKPIVGAGPGGRLHLGDEGRAESITAGFPRLKVAGRVLTGSTVIDLDAFVVKVSSDRKESARPTDEGGVGFVPNLVTCDNVDDVLVIDPRPGNATSNDAADDIAALNAAIAAIPGTYRRTLSGPRAWSGC